ncbi:sphingosine 1-phosphate receptor 3-like [Latimeria chalumnae]|uniref:sphingosine 1-phosphate receptor 3-like n=1 Tax=Latimeria chalumnae TaxID=7897 RepID=UPI0003C18AC7|nr:PREDICTED: sphingosine 1-phosphate receptor 3-like [Latimeria chalumnae]XP_014351342.1 PREDICTED: sphingosine 1-phosphate receptor 3-like [Latimeria chalumnae]XP_014351343.1 PREDICTED: sphingosine 1-phosphate receptor 3-like [Latimeria chalumnae]|eukprot:XP_006008166.1 PREDICTED: sphingosine 1-phosphate receptor 3-like [Latimeria chalumnae]
MTELDSDPNVLSGMNKIIVLHYNYSEKWSRRQKDSSQGVYKTVILSVICFFIVLENIMVLIAVWKNKKLHNRMYYFIGNLALSDLLAGLAYVINVFTSGQNTFFLTPMLWFMREGSMFVALSASTFSLLAIAIERHMTMINMKPYDARKKYRLFFLLGTCWIISVLLGSLPSLGWNCINNLPICSTVLPLYSKTYVAFCISIFTLILLAIVVLYVRIYRLVNSRSRRFTAKKNSQSERSMALLRTVVIVLGVFIICWAPLFVFLMLDVACMPSTCQALYETDWFIALAVLNSALNPLIYTLSSREMRGAFFKLLCCCLVGSKVARNFTLAAPTVENSRSKSSGTNSQKPKDDLDSPAILISAVLVKASNFSTPKNKH